MCLKVLSTPFRPQFISLSDLLLPSAEKEQAAHPLGPVRAFSVYIERFSQFRLKVFEQLFVCFRGCSKVLSVMKQRLTHWIVDAIDTNIWTCSATLGWGPTLPEEWLPPGHVLVGYPWLTSVRRPAGPCHPPLSGSTTWTSKARVLSA